MFPKNSRFLIIVVIMTISSSLVVANRLPTGCLADFEKCDTRHSELCQSRYCHASGECRTFGTTYDDSETEDHCARNPCPAGQICVWNTVTCIRAPCGPVTSCVDKCKTPCRT